MGDYQRVTTILLGAFGSEEIAAALGVKPQTFKQTRTQGVGRRNPPKGWEARLLPLVERLGEELAKAPRAESLAQPVPLRPMLPPVTKESQTRHKRIRANDSD